MIILFPSIYYQTVFALTSIFFFFFFFFFFFVFYRFSRCLAVRLYIKRFLFLVSKFIYTRVVLLIHVCQIWLEPFWYQWTWCKQIHGLICFLNMSHLVGKQTICIGENKDADQLRGNREADQRLCFRYTDRTIPLLLKSEISSF